MSKIDNYIHEATSRLRADSEIQLEVAQELRSHIECSIDDGLDGESLEEAEARALTEIGPSELIKEELLETHASRMKWKNRLFIAIQALVIPLLIVVMTWSLMNDSLIKWVSPQKIINGYSLDMMLFDGEKYPDNQKHINAWKMFYQCEWNTKNIHILKAELVKAQSLFPNNAWFDYVQLDILKRYEEPNISLSFNIKNEDASESYETLWKSEKAQACISLLEKAARKPEFSSYITDSAHSFWESKNSNISSRKYTDYLVNCAAIPSSDPIQNQEEIQRHIDTLLGIIDLTRREPTIVNHLVSIGIAKALDEHLGKSLGTFLLTYNVKNKLSQLELLTQDINQWRGDNNTIKDELKDTFDRKVKYKRPTSIFSSWLMVSQVPDPDFVKTQLRSEGEDKTIRKIFYCIVDRHVIQITAFILSIFSVYLYLRIFFTKRKSAYPNLKLSLNDRHTTLILIGSFIVPLTVYALLFVMNEHGSRAWSLYFGLPHWTLEILTLICSVIITPLYFITKAAHKRCIEIDVESKAPSRITKNILILLGVNWLYICLVRIDYYQYNSPWESWQNITAAALSTLLVCLLLYKNIIVPITQLMRKKQSQSSSHPHTLARTHIVYVVFPLMVCLFFANQAMKVHEQKLLEKEIIDEDGQIIPWSKAEHRVSNYFTERFDEIFSETK